MGEAGCLAYDLAEGRRAFPGGVLHDSGRWLVEHCVGLLGVGTLIVMPRPAGVEAFAARTRSLLASR